DPAVRPLLHTVSAHPGMHGRVADFLDAAAMELEFTGFATEAERAGACAEWVKEVHEGLAGGESEDPAVRPLLHTVSAHPGMH
ncbi:hypothetical protein JBF12_48880, partial [Streptomyces javensis]|nr:hypothetical protein [Streptomyces javensis]